MLVSPRFMSSVELDLVAHFLGIATHDNINAAPSGYEAARAESSSAPEAQASATVGGRG